MATSPVSRGDIEQTVDATGVIDAYKLVSVGAQASGQIKSLKVQLGDTVKEGDLIAEIDATTQQNQVLNAQASLDQVTASAPSSRPPCARPNWNSRASSRCWPPRPPRARNTMPPRRS